MSSGRLELLLDVPAIPTISGQTTHGHQQIHYRLLSCSELDGYHELLPPRHYQKSVQHFVGMPNKHCEMLATGTVTPRKPVLHGLLVGAGPTCC